MQGLILYIKYLNSVLKNVQHYRYGILTEKDSLDTILDVAQDLADLGFLEKLYKMGTDSKLFFKSKDFLKDDLYATHKNRIENSNKSAEVKQKIISNCGSLLEDGFEIVSIDNVASLIGFNEGYAYSFDIIESEASDVVEVIQNISSIEEPEEDDDEYLSDETIESDPVYDMNMDDDDEEETTEYTMNIDDDDVDEETTEYTMNMDDDDENEDEDEETTEYTMNMGDDDEDEEEYEDEETTEYTMNMDDDDEDEEETTEYTMNMDDEDEDEEIAEYTMNMDNDEETEEDEYYTSDIDSEDDYNMNMDDTEGGDAKADAEGCEETHNTFTMHMDEEDDAEENSEEDNETVFNMNMDEEDEEDEEDAEYSMGIDEEDEEDEYSPDSPEISDEEVDTSYNKEVFNKYADEGSDKFIMNMDDDDDDDDDFESFDMNMDDDEDDFDDDDNFEDTQPQNSNTKHDLPQNNSLNRQGNVIFNGFPPKQTEVVVKPPSTEDHLAQGILGVYNFLTNTPNNFRKVTEKTKETSTKIKEKGTNLYNGMKVEDDD